MVRSSAEFNVWNMSLKSLKNISLKSSKYFAIQYFEILCRHIICATYSRCGIYQIKCRNVLNQFDFLKTDICFRQATAHRNELNLKRINELKESKTKQNKKT